MLADLTEQYLVVVGTSLCNWLARGCAPHEVDSLTLELEFLAISDEEVFTSASNFNGLASVSETVRLLVVDEDVGSALALEPGLQHGLVLSIRE